MLVFYISNKRDIFGYVGKLPEQHFKVQIFSNPGDKMLICDGSQSATYDLDVSGGAEVCKVGPWQTLFCTLFSKIFKDIIVEYSIGKQQLLTQTKPTQTWWCGEGRGRGIWMGVCNIFNINKILTCFP